MYQPRFELVVPYVINFLKQNYWKLEGFMDWDDALGEARLQFVRTFQRLESNGSDVKNDAHAMSLFKTSWSRHFTTLTNKATQQRFITPLKDSEYQARLLDQLVDDDTMILFEHLLRKAPVNVRKVVKLLQTVDDDKFKQISKMFYQNREQCNAELCRQLGKNAFDQNLIQQTLDYLGI